MAEETTVVEEGQNGTETEQGTTIPELELGPEGSIETEEGAPELPSDKEEFVIPEKFAGKSAEEIAKAYVELEKFKGGKSEETETPSEQPEDAPQGNKYVNEYLESGELSEESYAELEKQGITKEDAKDRLEFEAYKQKKSMDNLTSEIGGVAKFQEMDAWAGENLSAEDIALYKAELAKASDYGKKAILKDLYGQYTKATTGEEVVGGDVIHTNEPQTVGVKGYTEQYQLQEDMSDPRYGTDKSYTKAVEKKLAATKAF